jgi:hypothetical protein
MFHQVINYEHVSVTFAIIIGVALQEYKEYNNLPHGYREPLNVIRKVSNIEYFNLHTSYCSFNATLMVRTKVIDTCR